MSPWFDRIAGYHSVKKKLERLVNLERVPHALLFYGPEEAPKKQFAQAFAQMILKTERSDHPDIRFYYPEGKIGLHAIATMRQFNEDVFLAPFEARKKVFVIMEAERMLPASGNALLKTFEEPARDSIIILVSSCLSNIIPTILSRCQKIQIGLSEREDKEQDSLLQLILNSLSTGMLASYSSILQVVDQVAAQIDEEAKTLENSLSDDLFENQSSHLTAMQKDSLRKEIDGAVSLQRKMRIKHLFIGLLSWYRDLYLLKVNGNLELLMNPALKDRSPNKIKELPPLQKVESAIRQALTALERSTSPKICFESLFLRLMEYHSA